MWEACSPCTRITLEHLDCRLLDILGVLAKAGQWKQLSHEDVKHSLPSVLPASLPLVDPEHRHACAVMSASHHVGVAPGANRADDVLHVAKFDGAALNAVISACTEAARPDLDRRSHAAIMC